MSPTLLACPTLGQGARIRLGALQPIMRAEQPAAIAHDQARSVGKTEPHMKAVRVAATGVRADGIVPEDVAGTIRRGEAGVKMHTLRHLEVTVRSAKVAVSSRARDSLKQSPVARVLTQDARGSTIASQGQAGKAEQHHRPCRGLGNGEWGRGEKLAVSNDFPYVVDPDALARHRPRKASQIYYIAAAPLGGEFPAGLARADHLPGVIDAERLATEGIRQSC
jgi:hypothetical protein